MCLSLIHIFLMKVYNQRDEMVVSGAEGMGVQLNHSSMQLGNQHLWGTKQFSVGEQITLQPAAGEILCYDAVVIPEEAKIIANKLVAKGDVKLHLLYLPVGEELPPQTSVQTIPISQIIDLPGVDEDYLISVSYTHLDVYKRQFVFSVCSA